MAAGQAEEDLKVSGSVIVGSAFLGGLVIAVELLMWWLLVRHDHRHDE